MTARFVSAGWPYLYDIPGLHNCVPMLFADIVARFYRLRGDDVLFVTGSDEHGARIEYVAQGYGRDPKGLVDEKHRQTLPLLRELGLSFDVFGRTSDVQHREFCSDFFAGLLKVPGAVQARFEPLPYCPRCRRGLPDRFVEGGCPHCGEHAFGNQCNNKKTCGRMLEAGQLRDPHCAVCKEKVDLRPTRQWYLNVRNYADAIRPHVTASDSFRDEVQGVVEATLRSVQEVSITRDSAWGIPVPGPDAEGKTIYNWVDSLLGKVSTVARFGPEREATFWKDPNASKVFCMGPDSVSFYGVLFPALLLAVGRGYRLENWCILPNEVFIYEGGVCSKSTGTGIWLAEALETLPADFWRFYIIDTYARRHETHSREIDFRWEKFASAVNRRLIDLVGGTAEKLIALSRAAAGPPVAGRSGASASAFIGFTEASCESVLSLLDQLRIGRAFLGLVDLFEGAAKFAGAREGNPQPDEVAAARLFLQRVTPLLSCYLPGVAATTWSRSGFPGSPATVNWRRLVREAPSPQPPGGEARDTGGLFPVGKLYHREVQHAYGRRVDARRAQRTLGEELTDARADDLCVCPVDLREQ